MGGDIWDERLLFRHADILDRSDAILCCRMLHEAVRSDGIIRCRSGESYIPAFISGCGRPIDDAAAFSTIMIRRLFPSREMRIMTTIDHNDAVAAWRISGLSDGVIVDTACSITHRMMVASLTNASPGRTWAVRSVDGVIRAAVMMGMTDPLPGVRSERVHDCCSEMGIEAFLIMDELPEEGSRWPREVIIVCDDPGAFARIIDPSSNPPIHHDSLETALSEFPDATITNHRVSAERPLRHYPEPRIVVYWHVGALDTVISPLIFNDQQHVLRCSGIMGAAERLCVGFVGPAYNEEEWRVHPRFRVLFHEPDPFCYEMPTLNAMLRDAQNTDEDYLILYFHTKGASSMMKYNRRAVNRWRRIMEWWNIVMFRRCVRLMLSNDLDALGGNLINMNPGGDTSDFRVNPDHSCHYSGNFWWSRASHVRRLPRLHYPSNDRQRLKAENWVLSALPRMRAGEAFRYQKVHMYDYVQSYTTACTGPDHFRLLCP